MAFWGRVLLGVVVRIVVSVSIVLAGMALYHAFATWQEDNYFAPPGTLFSLSLSTSLTTRIFIIFIFIFIFFIFIFIFFIFIFYFFSSRGVVYTRQHDRRRWPLHPPPLLWWPLPSWRWWRRGR